MAEILREPVGQWDQQRAECGEIRQPDCHGAPFAVRMFDSEAERDREQWRRVEAEPFVDAVTVGAPDCGFDKRSRREDDRNVREYARTCVRGAREPRKLCRGHRNDDPPGSDCKDEEVRTEPGGEAADRITLRLNRAAKVDREGAVVEWRTEEEEEPEHGGGRQACASLDTCCVR